MAGRQISNPAHEVAPVPCPEVDVERTCPMPKDNCPYNTRLLKGGALLDDMRMLVRNWSDEAAVAQAKTIIEEDLLGKRSRARAAVTCDKVFRPRYIEGDPPNAWKIVRELEDRSLAIETVRPVYYWITARSDRLLYDYVSKEILPQSKTHDPLVRPEEVAAWITDRFAKYKRTLSPTVTRRLAQGILSTLRDFGILEGAVKKRIAPAYLPVEAFAYLAFAIHAQGASGHTLVNHPDWALFLFTNAAVEHQFLEADRHGLLTYQAAGKIVRVDFSARTYKEMADVVAARAR